jgi:hypothetical protein
MSHHVRDADTAEKVQALGSQSVPHAQSSTCPRAGASDGRTVAKMRSGSLPSPSLLRIGDIQSRMSGVSIIVRDGEPGGFAANPWRIRRM